MEIIGLIATACVNITSLLQWIDFAWRGAKALP